MKKGLIILILFSSAIVIQSSPNTPAQGGSITAEIVKSRTDNCVAPCAIMFDATDTAASTTSRHFHDLYYEWDFGDDKGETWQYSGKQKNRAIGPVAAHVFDPSPSEFSGQPSKTYTITLDVKDGSGNTDQKIVQVTVTNPDTVFSGTNTICYRQNIGGDFSGCPSGASQVTSNSWTDIVNSAPGKRVLLRRGDTWSGSGRGWVNSDVPTIIGAFGTGAKPKIIDSLSSGINLQSSKDWRIIDLDISSGSDNDNVLGTASCSGPSKNILVYRVKTSGGSVGISFDPSVLGWCNQQYGTSHKSHENSFVIDSEVFSPLVVGIWAGSYNLAIMGTKVSNLRREHGIRTKFIGGGVIQHCDILPAPVHNLKLHSSYDSCPYDPGCGLYSENYIISDNTITGGNNVWTVGIGPQNAQQDERVRNVIVERNHFIAGSGTYAHLIFWAQDSTARNNIFDLSQSNIGITGVSASTRGSEDPTKNIQVYNNLCYSSKSTSNKVYCIDFRTGTGHEGKNNLFYAPGASGPSGVFSGTSGAIISNNRESTSNPFIVTNPVNPEDFKLDPGSSEAINYLIGQGAIVPVFEDYFGNQISSGSMDIGAFQYQAPQPCSDASDCDIIVCKTATCPSGECLYSNAPDDDPCTDDSLWCTGDETCQFGFCVSEYPSGNRDCSDPNPVCQENPQGCVACSLDSHCDDGNGCTNDICNVGVCENNNLAEGTTCSGGHCDDSGVCVECLGDPDCDDSNSCNGLETCSSGICASGTPPDCINSDGCCPSNCDETTDSDCAFEQYLVMHLEMEGDYIDSSGNGNDLTCSVCPILTTGHTGQAYDFENDNEEFLEIQDSSLSSGFPGKSGATYDEMTFTAWINPEGKGFIAGKDESGQRSYGFSFSDPTLRLEIHDSPTTSTGTNGITTINLGEWTHVAFTYKPNLPDYEFTLYVNGEVDITEPNAVGPISGSTEEFRIGNRGYSGGSTLFDGIMDEVRVNNKALSQSEIQNIMSGTTQQCNGPADNNPCDGCVDTLEIENYIDQWYQDSSQVTMVELVRALEAWKVGC